MPPKSDAAHAVRQSVLDRLIDLDPAGPADPPTSWGQSVRQLKAALCRDLEWLLNTRRPLVAIPDDCENVHASLLTYGLTDVSSLSSEDPDHRIRLVRDVENAITMFEPRLTAVHVSLAGDGDDASESKPRRREVHFVVEAMLRIDPQPEHVVFDTVLDTASGDYHVRSGSGA